MNINVIQIYARTANNIEEELEILFNNIKTAEKQKHKNQHYEI